jgi:hypothetical protein
MLQLHLLSLISLLDASDTWSRSQGTYVASSGPRSFVVDTARSGVVTSLAWNGRNILGFESGSFRPATQASWNNGTGWPPPPQWVDLPFRPRLLAGGSVLRLEGQVDARRLQPIRQVRFDVSDSSLVHEYIVRNTATDSARHVAPWEIVRLPEGALQFFPKGQELTGLANTLAPDREDSIVWVKDDGSRNQKILYRDGREGWMAAVVDSILLVKTWNDVPVARIPPGQGEVQVYLQRNPAFGEMECMGPWTRLAPGDSLSWTVRWYLQPVPSNISKAVGSRDLVALARRVVAKQTTAVAPRRATIARKEPVVFDVAGRVESRTTPSRLDPSPRFAAP